MRRRRVAPLLQAALAGAAALPAFAAMPLATEDAAILEAGQCEAEATLTLLRLPQSPRERGVAAQVACSLGGRAQATLGAGRETGSSDGRRHTALAHAKASLGTLPGGIELGAIAGTTLGRTGSDAFRFDSVYALGLLSAPLGAGLTAHANLGWARSREGERLNSTVWNLAVEAAVMPRVGLAAELYGDDRTAPWLGAALRVTLGDGVRLGAAYAVQRTALLRREALLGINVEF